MKLSVVVPVYNSSATLHHCLEAVFASARQPDAVIVVDDSSTDESMSLAQQYEVQILALSGGPYGPATARNHGADRAKGDVLVFIDADVAVHRDTFTRMEQLLTDHPEYVAVFGSYDTNPPVRTLISRYKNLMHHYVHQHGRPDASTFWSGCGAIHRGVFTSMGGFDVTLRYLEDIDLGMRMRKAGHRISLCPDIQGTHLKHWTLFRLLHADIWGRAVPWTHLILRERHLPSDLNLDIGSRLSAIAVWTGLFCLILGFWQSWILTGAVLATLLLVRLNWDLYRFFARHGGFLFAVGSAGLHALYLFYSSLTFVLIVGRAFLAGNR